ncbi:MAG: heparinase II/III family protein [Nitrospinota bacterium]|nr:heparinase II/III family protein [Nitrospinota bacterium]
MAGNHQGRIIWSARDRADRFLGSFRAWRLSGPRLARAMGARSIDDLRDTLLKRPYPAITSPAPAAQYKAASPAGVSAIMSWAGDALTRKVDLLGSGPALLAEPVDWSADLKTGHLFAKGRFRVPAESDPACPGDVKIPWELSRQQWLIPLGQAYLLTGEERYAAAARDYIEDWTDHNPYGATVNWDSAMEAAMRVFTWCWLFHAMGDNESWRYGGFSAKFLRTLYSHGEFMERRLDKQALSPIQYLTCSAGLLFIGLFFGHGPAPERWEQTGWRALENEIALQTHGDGVSRESSTSYHRLASELFLYPALYRQKLGMPIPEPYKARLRKMGAYIQAYSRPDGQSPLQGDGDGARALPFRLSQVHDHRYLPGIIGLMFDDGGLCAGFSGPRDEVFWILGPDMAHKLPESFSLISEPRSVSFRDGGIVVMKSKVDHLFINCGPPGMGGHGHNDLLSFEAYLNGSPVITDSGAYEYTPSAKWRDKFSETASHSTIMVNGEEINPPPGSLAEPTKPFIYNWAPGSDFDLFTGSHTGYHRLVPPAPVKRTIVLDKRLGALIVEDTVTGGGIKSITIPYHVAEGFSVKGLSGDMALLSRNGKRFLMGWRGAGWSARTVKGWFAPRYGVKLERPVVEFSGRVGPRKLLVVIMPAERAPQAPIEYAAEILGKLT